MSQHDRECPNCLCNLIECRCGGGDHRWLIVALIVIASLFTSTAEAEVRVCHVYQCGDRLFVVCSPAYVQRPDYPYWLPGEAPTPRPTPPPARRRYSLGFSGLSYTVSKPRWSKRPRRY